jgi:hypothetical protein
LSAEISASSSRARAAGAVWRIGLSEKAVNLMTFSRSLWALADDLKSGLR